MIMTFKDFKKTHKGGYYLYAAEDIKGFYKKGASMYGDCGDMAVVDYLYQPLNGIYTVYLKAIEFRQTTKGRTALVNGVIVWFIRDEPRLKPNEGWFVYKSEDGGETFKLIPAECTRNQNGDVDFSKHHVFGFSTLQTAKAFIYEQESKGAA